MLVFDMIELHMVFAYSKIGRVIVLNVKTINSFCLLHLVEMSVFRMLSVCLALATMTFICCENVSFGSRVIPRIFGCFVVGSVCLFNVSDRVVPYSAGSGVKNVTVRLEPLLKVTNPHRPINTTRMRILTQSQHGSPSALAEIPWKMLFMLFLQSKRNQTGNQITKQRQ